MEAGTKEKWLNTKEAAQYTKYSVSRLTAFRQEMKPPVYFKVNRSIRYKIDDLDSFLSRNKIDVN